MTDLRTAARAMRGNDNIGRHSASVPGPGHKSRKHRSLEVWIDADGRIAFHSWAGDPRSLCGEYLKCCGHEPDADDAKASAALRRPLDQYTKGTWGK